MLDRIILFFIGFILLVIGFVFIILYINLLSFGYTINEYLRFIIKRIECYNILFGLILIIISLFGKGIKNAKRL